MFDGNSPEKSDPSGFSTRNRNEARAMKMHSMAGLSRPSLCRGFQSACTVATGQPRVPLNKTTRAQVADMESARLRDCRCGSCICHCNTNTSPWKDITQPHHLSWKGRKTNQAWLALSSLDPEKFQEIRLSGALGPNGLLPTLLSFLGSLV